MSAIHASAAPATPAGVPVPDAVPTVAVVGLGYVGLPLALALGARGRTLGIDLAADKLAAYREARDPAGLTPRQAFVDAAALEFTGDAHRLADAPIIVIAVPTPVDVHGKPDLAVLSAACRTVGASMARGTTVIFESTVYPGATEEVCVPLLAQASGFTWKEDFFVGFSPERINPGDTVHTLQSIRKLVAGDTPQTLARVATLYESIVPAGVHRMPSLRAAELAKIVENGQRDINIAFVNEVARLCHGLGVDTLDVLEACGTKWNFLPFRPGLVGGDCVAIASNLLAFASERQGPVSRLLTATRRTNEGVAGYVAAEVARALADAGRTVADSRVAVLGLTFKEDVPDLRNTKVVDIIRELRAQGALVEVHDPVAAPAEAMRLYGIGLVDWDALAPADALVVAVGHAAFRALPPAAFAAKLTRTGTLLDVKGALDRAALAGVGIAPWRL